MRDTNSTTSRVDLHCHSTASAVAKLGVQTALGLPECATPPEEVYALAKRRGMDFVTITDHDTIAGALAIADRPDVFISEELTAGFRGEPQQVHVLCLGITPADHEWLQAHRDDVEVVATYLHEREITCALAHPFYAVAAPLTPRHRRRLAELFGIWEVRNGARDAELNQPAAIYIETHGGTGIGGTDDHAGIDIGRTFSETPHAATPEEFLAHVRAGRVEALGDQGSAARWAHNAMALAVRALGRGAAVSAPPDPAAVLRMVERVMSDSDARGGGACTDLGPDDARALLRAWLAAVELDLPDGDLLAYLQADEFSHADLYRRARRAHERKLETAVGRVLGAAAGLAGAPAPLDALLDGSDEDDAGFPALDDDEFVTADDDDELADLDDHEFADEDDDRATAGDGLVPTAGDEIGPRADDGLVPSDEDDLLGAALAVFEACVPAIPYAPAAAFLGREKRRLARRGAEPVRVALVADGVGSMHGVTHTLDEIRERGVPGFEVDVIGTDPHVDRRLPAVAEVEIPFYPGLTVGVPGVPAIVDALAEGRYELLHVCAPGPAGVVAALAGRMLGLPLAGSYHTELTAYAQLRSGDPRVVLGTQLALGAFYGQCGVVLSPSAAADATLGELGIEPERLGRWDRGVDVGRFAPARRDPDRLPGDRVNVLYAGRLTREKGADLLADAFLAARARDPRLQLVLAGGGPEEQRLRERLGRAATFLGWLDGEELAATYASADLFLFCSQTDTFGQVVLEAQASGLPVVAVGSGGPAELIEDGRSGLLCAPRAEALAGAVAGLAGSRAMRERLARGGLAAVRERTWEASLGRLAAGWRRALAGDATAADRQAA
jgi:glycosyltransferase involved in cell wall biosynthesis/predicted metal-dependent phosphoesterase TrpH